MRGRQVARAPGLAENHVSIVVYTTVTKRTLQLIVEPLLYKKREDRISTLYWISL
jgi:hypothetical protein